MISLEDVVQVCKGHWIAKRREGAGESGVEGVAMRIKEDPDEIGKRVGIVLPCRPLALRSFIEYSPSAVNMSAKPS